jgi:hypothetical protein
MGFEYIKGSGRNMRQGREGQGGSRSVEAAVGRDPGASLNNHQPFSKVESRPCYQVQTISMTESNFLFLIRQKKQFLKE